KSQQTSSLTFDCSMPETNTLNTKDVRMAKTENSGKVDSPSKGWDHCPERLTKLATGRAMVPSYGLVDNARLPE
ncbi:MAG: hypothetical protein NTW52_01980, partial [Planctomycetota bacterium]|nr:hypothetical protein [Planctomycetota bacterium]